MELTVNKEINGRENKSTPEKDMRPSEYFIALDGSQTDQLQEITKKATS